MSVIPLKVTPHFVHFIWTDSNNNQYYVVCVRHLFLRVSLGWLLDEWNDYSVSVQRIPFVYFRPSVMFQEHSKSKWRNFDVISLIKNVHPVSILLLEINCFILFRKQINYSFSTYQKCSLKLWLHIPVSCYTVIFLCGNESLASCSAIFVRLRQWSCAYSKAIRLSVSLCSLLACCWHE